MYDEIDVELYKKNQVQTIKYIVNTLKQKNIKYYTYNGNIFSINHKNSPMFSAHMDTVDEIAMITKNLYCSGGFLFRDSGVLGADDKAGVNLILNHCENINFVFSIDEEIGACGARDLVKYNVFLDKIKDFEVNCIVVLDRKGRTDIIGSKNNYCKEDLEKAVQKILSPLKYKPTMGVFCDADVFNEILPCVNLSVGYYNPHTSKEYLDVGDFKRINSHIISLATQLKGKVFKLPERIDYKDYFKWFDLKDMQDIYPFVDSEKDKNILLKEEQCLIDEFILSEEEFTKKYGKYYEKLYE